MDDRSHVMAKAKLEAQVSLYRSPDINKSSKECLHAEYI